MKPKTETLLLAGMCGVAVLLSLAGVAWVFASGMGFTLDAIFMLLVCLSTAGLFSLMMLLQLKAAGVLPSLPGAGKRNVPEAVPQSGSKQPT